ncbi:MULTISPECIES: hypothetical protein [Phyllobacterium]|jgi:hypothetical protein|uniref:hypothetical protein n=1 Tax=Phyllobacterium TaxID=28100 RepID=UPI001CBC4207|nr:hypothetical protein [Phyllobacterium calauticae]MBZ3695526.1 hypothetical protein [Phyllobacterium calauticae]
MQILDTRITPRTAGMGTYLVEFLGEGGQAIRVTLHDNRSDFDPDGLIVKAKAVMVQVANVPAEGESTSQRHMGGVPKTWQF